MVSATNVRLFEEIRLVSSERRRDEITFSFFALVGTDLSTSNITSIFFSFVLG